MYLSMLVPGPDPTNLIIEEGELPRLRFRVAIAMFGATRRVELSLVRRSPLRVWFLQESMQGGRRCSPLVRRAPLLHVCESLVNQHCSAHQPPSASHLPGRRLSVAGCRLQGKNHAEDAVKTVYCTEGPSCKIEELGY